MKAFLSACAVMIVLGIAAWAALDMVGMTSAAVNTAHNGAVRLD